MRFMHVLFTVYALVIIILLGIIEYSIISQVDETEIVQSHIIEQPCEAKIFIVNESGVFRQDDYLYYEILVEE
jgi:hypothetical protein